MAHARPVLGMLGGPEGANPGFTTWPRSTCQHDCFFAIGVCNLSFFSTFPRGRSANSATAYCKFIHSGISHMFAGLRDWKSP